MDKRIRNTVLKILVGVGLFAIILSRVDFGSVLENIKLLNLAYVPLLVLILVANYILSSIRWKRLLIHENAEKVTVWQLTSYYFIGAFFNNFMPTSIGGDVYKIFALGKKIGSKTSAFTATFMERLTGVIALVLISYFGLVQTMDFLIMQLPSDISSNSTCVFLFKFFVFFGFWIASILGFVALKFLSKKLDIAKRVYDSLMAYKNRKDVLAYAFVTSFVIQFLGILSQYLVFSALGVDLPLSYSLFIFPVITLVAFFVPSLNGLGVQDFLYVSLFLSVGVSSELALGASVIYHLLRLFVSLFGGVLYALNKND